MRVKPTPAVVENSPEFRPEALRRVCSSTVLGKTTPKETKERRTLQSMHCSGVINLTLLCIFPSAVGRL